MTDPTATLSARGVSIWLDDLSRERLDSGTLQDAIDRYNVVGVTTNPTIFAAALSHGDAYDTQIRELATRGVQLTDAVFDITTTDVQRAADVLRPVYDRTSGADGYVSIECEPGNARDAAATVAEATALWERIDRPNVMIKIPATSEGISAIRATIGRGMNVNVTLIFSLDRYREVIDAYLDGLQDAEAAGHDISRIHSVASFFISRVDTDIDETLRSSGSPAAELVRGRTGIANAHLAYELFQDAFRSENATALLDRGANKQRPLWASTGVKDPSLRDTAYVEGLVAEDTVNTMPEATLLAVHDHGDFSGDPIPASFAPARSVMIALPGLGIDFRDVTDRLEEEGLAKFSASWTELLDTVDTALRQAR